MSVGIIFTAEIFFLQYRCRPLEKSRATKKDTSEKKNFDERNKAK